MSSNGNGNGDDKGKSRKETPAVPPTATTTQRIK